MDFIIYLAMGLLAGFLAGKLYTGSGLGLIGNLFIGLLGSAIGGWIAKILHIGSGSLLASLAISVGGAILLLFVINKIRKK